MNAIGKPQQVDLRKPEEAMIIGYSAGDRRNVNRCPEALRRSIREMHADYSCRCSSARIPARGRGQAERLVQLAVYDQTRSEVLTEPRNPSLGRRSHGGELDHWRAKRRKTCSNRAAMSLIAKFARA